MPEAFGTIGPNVNGALTATFTLDDGKVAVYTTAFKSLITSKPNEAKLTYVKESDLHGKALYSGTMTKEKLEFNLRTAGTSFTAAITGGPDVGGQSVTGTGYWEIIS